MPVISRHQALSIASMVDLTDKDIQPLQFIKLDFNELTLKAYATDRYVLARAIYELDEPANEPITIYLDRGAVKFIKDNAKTATTFTLTQDTITANNLNTYALISDGSTLPKHDYDSLITKAQEANPTPEQVMMNLDLITRIHKLVPPSQTPLTPAKRRVEWNIRVGAKHDALILTDSSNTFTALAQPLRRGN